MSPINEVLVGKHTFKKLKVKDGLVSIVLKADKEIIINTDLVDGYLYFKKENGYAKYGMTNMKLKPSKIHYIVLMYKNGDKSMLVVDSEMYEVIKKSLPLIKEEAREEDD